jgi:hypothetical protein
MDGKIDCGGDANDQGRTNKAVLQKRSSGDGNLPVVYRLLAAKFKIKSLGAKDAKENRGRNVKINIRCADLTTGGTFASLPFPLRPFILLSTSIGYVVCLLAEPRAPTFPIPI